MCCLFDRSLSLFCNIYLYYPDLNVFFYLLCDRCAATLFCAWSSSYTGTEAIIIITRKKKKKETKKKRKKEKKKRYDKLCEHRHFSKTCVKTEPVCLRNQTIK